MSLTFEAFRSSSFVKQFTVVDIDDEESEATIYQSAEVLHAVYCADESCEWEAEEALLPDEWVGSEHQAWLRVADRVNSLGISLSDAVQSCEEVYARTGMVN